MISLEGFNKLFMKAIVALKAKKRTPASTLLQPKKMKIPKKKFNQHQL